MAAFADGFDDSSENEFAQSPLPQDDRLWRHPSEVGNAAPWSPGDATTVRKRWIERETSRGSAWTAGIVGAILATGVVALGTHLATALTSPPVDSGPAVTDTTVPAASELASAGRGSGPEITGLSAAMTSRIQSVGQSMVVIDVGKNGTNIRCLGLIIRSNGVLMAPATAVAGASSLLVTLANGVQYVGNSAGDDATSGVAILRINGAKDLPTVAFNGSAVATGEMAVAVTATDGNTYSLGTVATPDVATGALVDSLATDLSTLNAPLGSAVLDPRGNVVGMVTGVSAQGVVATPAWLAAPIANELITSDHVTHGWLGMVNGSTVNKSGTSQPGGVAIASLAQHSAASQSGLVAGDVITAMNGRPITTLAMLRGRLYVLPPGTTVRLKVLRNHKYLTLNIPLDRVVPN